MLRTVLMLWIAIAGFGCVQRTITVTSDPPGALVHLNDEEVGRTPVTVPFLFYGVYDVRLQLDGHRTLHTTGTAAAPWQEVPPFDVVHEMSNTHLRYDWHYRLEPAEEADPAGLIERAKKMEARTLASEPDATPK